MLNVGIVGYGYWGPNLVRNFVECTETNVTAICDLSDERLRLAQKRWPSSFLTRQYRDFLMRSDIDVVCIATPVAEHYSLALEALDSGRHVLIAKPMCHTTTQAIELAEQAAKRNLILAVDHTFLFTGAVRYMRHSIQKGDLGHLYYYDSTRINLGLFQKDSSVIWDLAAHDVAILDFLIEEVPGYVTANGASHITGTTENVAYITMVYQSGFIAHINVNWLAPMKIRQTLLAGDRKMIVYDDIQPTEKIKVYDRGVKIVDNRDLIYSALVSYRTGDVHSPKLDEREALSVEALHLADCINRKQQPINDAASGIRVIHVLEAAERSLRTAGRPIELDPARFL